MAMGRKTHEARQSAFTVWFATTLFQSSDIEPPIGFSFPGKFAGS